MTGVAGENTTGELVESAILSLTGENNDLIIDRVH